ncbi:beta-ketoacyl-ACP synthase III [Streptomyces sp. NPDC007205]|uniref:beta-ketoacyl-ACP synthase III n=1 Tax=Streptomyces sp. NPDC007205 TaxID=3154316 RepID=UPI0033D423CD
MPAPTAVIAGLGACLPARRITNEQLENGLHTSDAWIRQRTGIGSRHWAEPGTSTADLAVTAGRSALASAQTTTTDLVIVATTTPDHRCPATAPQVAWRLGLVETPAFDLAAVCSGFVYALSMASAAIRAQAQHQVLVIGADTYSTIIDPQDRTCAVIFGDGAGAALVRRGAVDEPGALTAFDLGSEGEHSNLVRIDAGGSRHPDPDGHASREERYFRMHGSAVFHQAVRRMTASSQATLRRAGWATDSIEAFIGHQANQRILDTVADRLAIPADHRFGNLAAVGNTAAASIPLALTDAAARQAVRPGARTLLTAFGGGLAWGSAALTWPDVQPELPALYEPGAIDNRQEPPTSKSAP